MQNIKIINLTPKNIHIYGVCGYKNVKKHIELKRKIQWFQKYKSKGLKIKAVITEDATYQGMIEYIPGEFAHRPVSAKNYMFIHCIFVGFKKEYKAQGLGTRMINECIKEAKETNMAGVAVITRKGSFMAKKDIFLKHSFKIVDKAKPDFELLALKFKQKSQTPQFNNLEKNLNKYNNELTVIRSFQCPYTEKNVNSIIKTAKEKFNLKAKLIELKDHKAVQNSPCAFGVFCIIFKGEILSYHPISNTRFENILNKKLKNL